MRNVTITKKDGTTIDVDAEEINYGKVTSHNEYGWFKGSTGKKTYSVIHFLILADDNYYWFTLNEDDFYDDSTDNGVLNKFKEKINYNKAEIIERQEEYWGD